MEVKKTLLCPFFECYKFTETDDIKVKVNNFPLKYPPASLKKLNSVSSQVLSDKVFENKLKSSSSFKTSSPSLFYLSNDYDLISFSKDNYEIAKRGPIDSFLITEFDDIVSLAGDTLTFKDLSFNLLNNLPSTEYKLLKAIILKSGPLVILLQCTGKLKDLNGTDDERLYFGFYRIEIDGSDLKCLLLGWSLSRPLIKLIQVINDEKERILLGTSSGVTLPGSSNEVLPCDSEGYFPSVTLDLFDENEDEDAENDFFNNCRVSEFIDSSFNFEYPEFTISGSCSDEFHIPTKHLHDTLIFHFKPLKPDHISTFPALHFIQNGKIEKKFTVFTEKFAFILESFGNIYCYSSPGSNVKVSPQYLIELKDDDEVLGWAFNNEILYLLTSKNIYTVEII